MAQYINKNEVENILRKLWKEDNGHNLEHRICYNKALEEVQCELDTLEVKEVDFDFMLHEYWDISPKICVDCLESATMTKDEMIKFAKHFFELGISVNNPITAADRGTAEEIIINLKRVEQDYHIDLTREIEWVRNKVKKEK